MDDATRLISELQAKLTELDSKVAAYRHDMAAEFTRYSDQLLQNLPQDVQQKVSRAVADSMPNYPSLNPPSLDEPRSPTPTELPNQRRGRISPPPILPHTSGTPKELVRSPHDREKEFQGLFTPRYLPLLDGSERPLHSPPTSPPISPPPVSDNIEQRAQLEVAQNLESKPAEEKPRPPPIRRPTDGTTSSIDSVGSDTSSKVRKSALRRSSSISKPPDSPRDPRRVRFEFQGAEVLPTSSPQSSEPTPAEPGSAEDESAFPDDSFPESSLGDIEGEEDPPPRKVSSSQALRALSRSPLDAGTVWTVVNPDPEPEEIVNPDGQDNAKTSPDASSPTQPYTMSSKPVTGRSKATSSRDTATPEDLGSRIEGLKLDKNNDKEDDVSDDDSLFMSSKKRKGSISPAPQSPVPTASKPIPLVIPKSNKPNSTAPKAHPLFPSEGAPDDDAEDLFDLEVADDDEGLKKVTSAKKSSEKHLPEPVEDEATEAAPKRKPLPVPTYSSSPAMNIPRSFDVNKQPPKSPPIPAGSYVAGSVGSFKGRPLYMGSVKDPKILEEVMAMGEVATFVGSVNGRSGVDASNPKSYRATMQSPGQTPTQPTSFTERYIKERDEKGGYDTEEEKQSRNDYF